MYREGEKGIEREPEMGSRKGSLQYIYIHIYMYIYIKIYLYIVKYV